MYVCMQCKYALKLIICYIERKFKLSWRFQSARLLLESSSDKQVNK